MKSKVLLYYLAAAVIVFFSGCERDNVDAPQSTISGNIVYNGQAIGLRSTGAFQLELWQRGYQLFNKIPVYIDQYGHYSAKVYDGDYKLVRLPGTFPWKDARDSINVTVKGSAIVDVPVEPYFMLSNISYVKSGTTITATFTVVNATPTTGKTLELVRVYLGGTIITDQNNNVTSASKAASGITLGSATTQAVTIPTTYTGKTYVYARLGVKTTGVTELIYSAPQKIELP